MVHCKKRAKQEYQRDHMKCQERGKEGVKRQPLQELRSYSVREVGEYRHIDSREKAIECQGHSQSLF